MKEQTIYSYMCEMMVQERTKTLFLKKTIIMAVDIQNLSIRLFRYLIYCVPFIMFANGSFSQNAILSNENISVEIKFQNYKGDSLDVISFMKNTSADTIWLAINSSNYVSNLDGSVEIYFGWDQGNPHDLLKMSKLLPGEKIIIDFRIRKVTVLSVNVLCSYVENKYINSDEILGSGHLILGRWDEFTINKLIILP